MNDFCTQCGSQWIGSMVWPKKPTPERLIISENIIQPVLITPVIHYTCLDCSHRWTSEDKKKPDEP